MAKEGTEGVLSDSLWDWMETGHLTHRCTESDLDKRGSKSPNQRLLIYAHLFIQTGDLGYVDRWLDTQEYHMGKEWLSTIYSAHYIIAVICMILKCWRMGGNAGPQYEKLMGWLSIHFSYLSAHARPVGNGIQIWTPGSRSFGQDNSRDDMFAILAQHLRRKALPRWNPEWGKIYNRDAGAIWRACAELPLNVDLLKVTDLPQPLNAWIYLSADDAGDFISMHPKGLKKTWSDPVFGVSYSSENREFQALAARNHGDRNSRLMIKPPEGVDYRKRGKVEGYVRGGDLRLTATCYVREKKTPNRYEYNGIIGVPRSVSEALLSVAVDNEEED